MKFTIRIKLLLAFLTLGLTPLLVIGFVVWRSSQKLADATAKEYQSVASEIADKIDRNLFERYGDVQAFGLNRVVQNRDEWYKPGDANPIVQVMDAYVATYDIYYLTLLVDLEGKLIAVNNKDDAGRPIDTAALYSVNYYNTPWFTKTAAKEFLSSKDGSFTGTYVEDATFDPTVAKLFKDDGLSLKFAAPVVDASGKTIALWCNIAKFSLVEEVVQDAYRNLKQRGLSSAELTLLDSKGTVLVDYDPMMRGNESIVHDPKVIGSLNLAQTNNAAVVKAVAGEPGSFTSLKHTRKNVDQVAGFSPSRGALGYPGLGWIALVRVNSNEALAEIQSVLTQLNGTFIASLVIILIAAFAVTAGILRPINATVSLLKDIAQGEGDLTKRLDDKRGDEMGELGLWFNTFVQKLRGIIQQITDAANHVSNSSTDLSATATQLSQVATETTKQSASVAAATEQMTTNMKTMASSTEQTSSNVKTVSAAVEEMTASIAEIARNSEQSAMVADNAARLAEVGNQRVKELGDAAAGIGKVIEVIQDIAEQTNLLALNATIEAARAGDAGKGFAVVANEVKELAKQTASATEDIRRRIEGIQNTTADAVRAITEISGVVREVNGVSRSIASAVEEQSITTNEISRRVADTAQGTDDVSRAVSESATASQEIARNITRVDDNARQTTIGANSAQAASAELAKVSRHLQTLVAQFKV